MYARSLRLVAPLALAVLAAACATPPPRSSPPSRPADRPRNRGTTVTRTTVDTQPTSAGPGRLCGTVREVLPAAPYVYLRVDRGAEEAWFAVPAQPTPVGTTICIEDATPMDNFDSKALGRRFARVHFGHVGDAAPRPADPPPARPMPTDQVIQPPAGGYSVARVWRERSSLAHKPVRVKGKVVKFDANILGVNWIHLRDGSGTAEARDHDLTVTTAEVATVGEIVTVEGVVALGRDFGAGYTYPVILEEARVER